jgi:hypothetical protein
MRQVPLAVSEPGRDAGGAVSGRTSRKGALTVLTFVAALQAGQGSYIFSMLSALPRVTGT